MACLPDYIMELISIAKNSTQYTEMLRHLQAQELDHEAWIPKGSLSYKASGRNDEMIGKVKF